MSQNIKDENLKINGGNHKQTNKQTNRKKIGKTDFESIFII